MNKFEICSIKFEFIDDVCSFDLIFIILFSKYKNLSFIQFLFFFWNSTKKSSISQNWVDISTMQHFLFFWINKLLKCHWILLLNLFDSWISFQTMIVKQSKQITQYKYWINNELLTIIFICCNTIILIVFILINIYHCCVFFISIFVFV